MNLSIEFSKPIIDGGQEWLLTQEINVTDEQGDVIAKAEIQLLTMNKHRDAKATYALLEEFYPDWEIPLNIYFKKHNLTDELCLELNVPTSSKAQTHIMIEAISVQPAYRGKGVGQYLLQEIAQKHKKAQSLTVLSMPLNSFIDVEDCEEAHNRLYYSQLDLANDTVTRDELKGFFNNNGFTTINIDEDNLIEPLAFDVLVASPISILD